MNLWVSAALGIAMVVISAYLGITRDRTGRRVQRVGFLFGVIFAFFAMWIGVVLITDLLPKFGPLTAENFESTMLKMRIVINLFIGIPGLAFILRLVSMRCRDAGYRPGLAYLGAVPALQLLFLLWLMFPRSARIPAVASAA